MDVPFHRVAVDLIQGFETIEFRVSIKLLSAIVKLRIPPAILLAWRP